MEVYLDARVYDTGMVTVIEIMGRNAGWLTASAALAAYKGLRSGPDLPAGSRFRPRQDAGRCPANL